MTVLLAYLTILAFAAGITFLLFGEVGTSDVAPTEALALFHSSQGGDTVPPALQTSRLGDKEVKAEAEWCAPGTGSQDAQGAADGAATHIQALLTKAGVSPQQQEMISFLQRHCCALPVASRTVHVLTHPTIFYEELKKKVMAAEHSITLSALYIGDGPLSKAFVACLENRVRWAAAHGRSFCITILLDYNRMQDRKNLVTLKTLMELAQQTARGSTSSPTSHEGRSDNTSGVNASWSHEGFEEEGEAGEKIQHHPQRQTAEGKEKDEVGHQTGIRVRLSLYQNPSKWNRLFAPFGRAKEVLGVQHTKLFIFDGRHTILTGANLSDDYFATRMDRYVLVEDNALVAQWFERLVRTLCRLSHPVVCRKEFADYFGEASRLQNGGQGEEIAWQDDRHVPPATTGSPKSSFPSPLRPDETSETAAAAPVAVVEESQFASPPAGPVWNRGKSLLPLQSLPSPTSKRIGSPTLHRRSDLILLPNALQMDPSVETEAFCRRAKELLVDFAAWARRRCTSADVEWSRYDTVLFPTLQVGRAGLYHDSAVVRQLLRLSTAQDHIFLTSPYLNMHPSFVDEVLRGASSVDCITASVQTNGWNGQRGMAGRIPFFYLQLERAFYYLMRAYHCLHRVRIREFSVEGLTFHAKGLWFSRRRGEAAPAAEGKERAGTKEGRGDATDTLAWACTPDSMSAPFLVAYGSTNYGYRSVHKDVEAEAFLFTADAELRETLRQELLFLLARSVLVTESQFVGTAAGRFQPVISLIAHLAQDFL